MEPYVDEHGKTIVDSRGDYLLAVNSLERPTFFSLWFEDKKVGEFMISDHNRREGGGKYAKISQVTIKQGHRGEGMGTWLYRSVLKNLPSDYRGLYSYLPDVINKTKVPRIHKRLGGETVDGDHMYINKPTSRLDEAILDINCSVG